MKNKLIKNALIGCLSVASILGIASTALAVDVVNNTSEVKAMWTSTNGSTIVDQGFNYPISLYNYGSSDWGIMSGPKVYYNNDKTTPVGNYTISFSPSQEVVTWGFSASIRYYYCVNVEDDDWKYIELYNGTFNSTNKFSYSFQVDDAKKNGYLIFDMKEHVGNYQSSIGNNDSATFYFNDFRWLVTDTLAPVFEKQVFMVDVDKPPLLKDILKLTKFVDAVDGEHITEETDVIEDNYTSNRESGKPGKYLVKVKWSDKAGNSTTGEIEIWLVDKTAPTITGTSVFTSNMSSPLTLASIKSSIHVTDNVDEDVELNVVEDNFTGHENEVGVKTIKFNATDSAGNTSVVFEVNVTCVDDVKPTITFKDDFNTKIKVSYTQKLNLATAIEQHLVLSDNITDSSSLQLEKIEDRYTGNHTIPATYVVKYRTRDGAGNYSDTLEIEIEVIDDVAPGFYVSGHFIGISQANTMSHEDIVAWISYIEELTAGSQISFVSMGGYNVNGVNKPGTYQLIYVTKVGEEISENKYATIKVFGEETNVGSSDEEKVEQRVNKFKDTWNKIWKNVGEFFVKVYRSFAFIFTLGKVKPNWKNWY